MALRKNTYPIVIDGGLNTKLDPVLVPTEQNLVLENAIFTEVGALKKRSGFSDYNFSTAAGYDDPDVIVNMNEKLFVFDKRETHYKSFYNLDDDEWNFHPYGSIPSDNIDNRSANMTWMAFVEDKYSNEYSIFHPFMIELPGQSFRIVSYIMYNENVGSPEYTLFVYKTWKNTDRKVLLYSLSGSAKISSQELRISPNNLDNLHIFYVRVNGANHELKHTVYSITNGTNVTSNTVTTYPTATGILGFSTIVNGNNILVAADKTNTTTTSFQLINSSGTIIDTEDVTVTNAHWGTEKNCYALCNNGSYVYCFFRNNSASDTCVTYIGLLLSGTISVDKSETLISTFAKVGRLSAIYSTSLAKIFLIQEYGITTGLHNNGLSYSLVTAASGANTLYQACPGGNLASRLFKDPADPLERIFWIGQSGVPNQERYYIYSFISNNLNFYVLGSFGTNGLAGLITKVQSTIGTYFFALDDDSAGIVYNLPEVCVGENSYEYFYPAPYYTRIISLDSGITYFKIASLFIVKLDQQSEYYGINAKLGNNYHFAGSHGVEYDGYRFIEQSFLDSTKLYGAVTANAGSLSAGTYLYRSIYEYTDNNGQVHRSAPSEPFEISGATGKTVLLSYNVQDIDPIRAVNGVKKLNLVVYRTAVNGSVYYRLSSTRFAALYGVTGIYFEDGQADTAIIGNEELYTNGGILPNEPMPSSKYLLVANNRLFSISSEDENRIDYSQPYIEGESVNFSSALSLRGDAGLLSESGKCMALASLDDKIIILKDKSIAFFYGDGPNQAGLQNTFTDPKLITSNIGISDIKSIATIPDGIMFKSIKGIYLLDRSMSLSYIGAPVESYNSETIIGACVFETKHIALFMSSSLTLAYDYLVKKWSVWTISGRSLCLYNGVPAYIDTNGAVMVYSEGSYLDAGSRYSLKIATAWIKLDGIQNYQRVYKISIFGEYYSEHDLTVNVYYDYDETDFDTYTLSPLETDSIYQYEIQLRRQKCQAFKIEVYDQSSDGTNQSFKLTNITAVIGKKEGLNQIEDSRRY